MIGDRDDVTTNSSQIVQQQQLPRHKSAFRLSHYPSDIASIPATKKKKDTEKSCSPHPALQNLPLPRHFGFGPSSSFPQLWLQSIKLDSNKQYVSRLLRGYRRLKKLFKVRDPSPSGGAPANLAYRKSPSSISSPLALFFFFFLRTGGDRRDSAARIRLVERM